MNKKLYKSILLISVFLLNTTLILAGDFNEEDWRFIATATGNTTGHIGDLTISNKTEKANSIWLGSYIIPSENGKQGYAILKEDTEQIEVKPGDSFIHKLNGYCINVNLPAVAEEEAFPHYLKWLTIKNFDTAYVKQWNQTEKKPETLNFNTQLKQAAPIILEAIKNLEEEYYTWKSPLQIPDLYPGNADAVKEAIIQQALWQFTAALQGKPYTFPQFEESLTKQDKVKAWLSSKGTENVMIDHQTLKNKTYFNYQCQKLWSMITDLNFYINSSSRKLLPNWERNTGEIQDKYIEFIELWESIALTGDYFKSEKNIKAAPVAPKKTSDKEASDKKKIIPYVAGGVGVAGVVTGVILLTGGEKGCTDPLACNYNADAKKDDDSCKYDDCKGVCDGDDKIGARCDDGDENTADDVYNTDCICKGSLAGCTEATACNYNPQAQINNGTCLQLDCLDECGGSAIEDCKGVCNGDDIVGTTCTDSNGMTGVYDSTCNCAVDSLLGCTDMNACNYVPEATEDDKSCTYPPTNFDCNGNCLVQVDCAGNCGGSATLDCTNECGGTVISGTACTSNNGAAGFYNDNCVCIETAIPGCKDMSACNYNENATVDDNSCNFPPTNFDCDGNCLVQVDCDGNCGGTATLDCDNVCNGNTRQGSPCDDGNPETYNDAYNANCVCVGRMPNCNLNEGVVQFCNVSNDYYLFNVNNVLYNPLFDLVNTGCFYEFIGYEGQKVKFDYIEIDTLLSCNLNVTPIMVTCLEVEESNSNCSQFGSLYYNTCNNSDYALIELDNGKKIDPWNSYNCRYFFLDGRNFPEGQRFKLDYEPANFDYPCDPNNVEAVVLTCIEEVNCSDPCDPDCLKTGTIRFNENCFTDIERNCKQIPHYLIEYGGNLFSAKLNTADDDCFYGYDGQKIKFNFEVLPENEIDASYVCSDIATPIKITCFEPIPGNCESKQVELIGIDCTCLNRSIAALKTPDGEILSFVTSDCLSSGSYYFFGDYKVDYFDSEINPGCNEADKFVVVTCIEPIGLAKTNETQPSQYNNALSPFVENRILTTPIQNSEFPETTVITNILGINYHQPLSPTIFIENQTAIGYVPASDLYFLNNKMTVNANNPNFPIHYGIGFNSNQLSDIISLTDWQNELIWNLGIKLPVFKKFQLEAEVFKSFNLEDDPNCSIRLIYKAPKANKEEAKRKKF